MSTPSTMVDCYDQLESCCDFAEAWPSNLFRSKCFRHTSQSYRKRIAEVQERLFDPNPEYALVEFLEAFHGEHGFHSTKCNNLVDLKRHLRINRKDPICRHVFFEAEHSRAPLDCSKEMFVFSMSFLQVMAPFVDLLLGFGQSQNRKEFHYTSFRHENYLVASKVQDFEIPRLGRSGLEIKLCYNLWSVETSVGNNSAGSFRQTALYHSFDLRSGRSLWVNISVNAEMKNRITDAASSYEELTTEALVDIQGSFSASLTTHLVAFEWCSENWRQYITKLETTLRAIINKVQRAPVGKMESTLALDTKNLLKALKAPISSSQIVESNLVTSPDLVNPGSPASPFNSTRTFTRRSTLKSAVISPLNTRASTNLTATSMQSFPGSPVRRETFSPILGCPPESSTEKKGRRIHHDQDPFDMLKDISLEKLQELNGIGADLHTAGLVMKLDSDVLRDVMRHYQSLVEAEEFPANLKACRPVLAEFSRRATSIVRALEMEQTRIATLMLLFHDGRGLFEHVLQFRNLEQSKLFNATANISQQRMEEFTEQMHKSTLNMESVTESMHVIAQKTEKDTSSMHVITIVTLLFLPGTFVAVRLGLPTLIAHAFTTLLTYSQTFFGSGLFQWDEANPEMSFPIWKGEFFKLFAKICFPLMGATITIWCFVSYLPFWRECLRACWNRLRACWNRKKLADEEQGTTAMGVAERELKLK
ncbi:hypothetical protein QC762_508290 [Podospora pseudocomata]|uniref:CorA-like transporter domain-containing protein n=1 Tax=Podospora pseudocomata TaxID=2093779 RepID=A0ABR0GD06_9PEZI|nr:hypothetical protein QC762_508290 [Podospora pseudocomata]